jgi:hypothetical protein
MLSQGINSQKVIVPERDWWPKTRVIRRDYLAAVGAQLDPPRDDKKQYQDSHQIQLSLRAICNAVLFSDQDEGACAFGCRPGLPPLHDDPLHVFVAPS